MAGPERPSDLERLISSAAGVVAPLSVITALLFYFGYASSRAQYEYFGVDVDTIGLSTQDYVMRSPQPLLTPLLLLTLLGLAVVAAHAAARSRITRVDRLARGMIGAGLGAFVLGVVLLAGFPYLREWAPYALATAVVLALGAACTAYGLRLRKPQARSGRNRQVAVLAIYIVLAASVFWATATLAEWSGRGSARYSARHLDRLPSVILDTKERLYLTSPNIGESQLSREEGQQFHYRYRGLRLLIQGRDRLFLVPHTWSPSNSTLVLPMGDGVRLQFQFQNQRP
jgi:hypothetical protein